jgi:signal transduction histidine kinase
MSKLSRKLTVYIVLVVCAVFVLSLLVNTLFVPKYVLYKERKELETITKELQVMPLQESIEYAKQLNEENHITVVYESYDTSLDGLNERLRNSFVKQRVTLNKFWITEKKLAQVEQSGIVSELYDQEKLKSSFLVTLMKKDDMLFVVGKSIAHVAGTIQTVNNFNIYITISGVLLAMVLARTFSKRIVSPITELQYVAKDIAELTFSKACIQTGDEIEALASSINEMSEKLQEAQKELERKNNHLQRFLADISHELKTPLAVVKAYVAGIQDGLDDGTYLYIIQQQTDDMTRLVEELLRFSKLQTETYVMEECNLEELLHDVVKKYELTIQQQRLSVHTKKETLDVNCTVIGDKKKLGTVIDNIVSNAVKYSTNHRIDVIIRGDGATCSFSIKNGVSWMSTENVEKIWEPFYVMEKSRNKAMSGTGLGLSIVAEILKKHGALYGHNISDGELEVYFSLARSQNNGTYEKGGVDF